VTRWVVRVMQSGGQAQMWRMRSYAAPASSWLTGTTGRVQVEPPPPPLGTSRRELEAARTGENAIGLCRSGGGQVPVVPSSDTATVISSRSRASICGNGTVREWASKCERTTACSAGKPLMAARSAECR